ncbi:MAG: hypothetical protein AAF962_07300 [Actinomycetota bacterium]
MSETDTAEPAVASGSAAGAMAAAVGDERLAYRSIFQRLFIRPEIGAVIGVIGVWSFFWAVSLNFGTTGQTQNWLDTAATLGIMAVAVSMLMIGGEFDLSSGANTGAMGILFILLIKEVGDLGGLGLSIWIAVPLSFVVAMAIGFFNGWMVERTALPSFIVTLATFFILRGLKLGLAKLLTGQISVTFTNDAHGYDFFRPIFAGEWQRNEHIWNGRDVFYIAFLLIGAAIVALAVCEMHFVRRAQKVVAGLPIFALGAAGVGVGVYVMHATDGVVNNTIAAAIHGVSILVGLYGFALWRFEPLTEAGGLRLDRRITLLLGAGLACVAAASVASFAIDSANDDTLFFPFTVQGLRVVLMMLFAGAGFTALMVAANRALRDNATTKLVVSTITAGAIVAFGFVIRASSEAVKFRTELFSVLLLVGLALFAWSVLGLRFAERRRIDADADRAGVIGLIVGLALLLTAVILRHLFVTEDELLANVNPAKFSVRMLWFFGFTAVMVWILGRTKFGSWTFAVGGNKEAARQVGVPAARTKTQLFMIVSGAAWLVGMLLAFRLNSLQAGAGDGEEFEYIIAAVVGGTMLTGGYGTALGAAFGAAIMAMSLVGIQAARWNTDWRFVFLGVILLLAVIANRAIRDRAEAARR